MEVFHDGPVPVIAAICRQIGVTELLNQLLCWDEAQCRLSPGHRLEALIMNILVDRHPLYVLPQATRCTCSHSFFRIWIPKNSLGPGFCRKI